MNISGIEKVTLVNYPGKVAMVVFTQGCNCNCSFCQNSGLISLKNEGISHQEIFTYLEKRKEILDGVVISGGEPTIQKDLLSFVKRIKELGLLVKLDTNGLNPKVLKELLDQNLVDYVAMDIKNDFDKYEAITGVKKINIKALQESIKFILESKIDYEFRTTVIKNYHDYDKLRKIANYLGKETTYYLQNFEDSENVIDKSLEAYSKKELKTIYLKLKKEFPNINIRGI